MGQFEPEVVEKKAVQDLLAKVIVQPSDRFTEQYPKHWGCFMKLTMQDGTCYETEVEDPSGSVERPLSRAQARNKAEEFLSVVCPGREQETIEKILNLAGSERLPVI